MEVIESAEKVGLFLCVCCAIDYENFNLETGPVLYEEYAKEPLWKDITTQTPNASFFRPQQLDLLVHE